MSSTEVTTQPATGWVALSAPDRHLIVEGSSAVAGDLQGPLEAGLVEVLAALSRDGLGALPDFAVVDTSGERTRVVVRGAAVVRADGSDVVSDGRMPWRDVDLDAAAIELGDGSKGGWRRPTRLGRPVVAAVESEPVVEGDDVAPGAELEPEPAVAPADEAVEEPEEEPVAAAEPEPEVAPEAESESEPEPVVGAPPVPPADLTLPPSEEFAGAAPAERIPPIKPAVPDKKVLIDSVPWRTLPGEAGSADTAAAAAAAAEPDESAAPIAPPVAAPPVPVPDPMPVAEAADGPTGPDNWGMTGPPPSQVPADELPPVALDPAALDPAAPDAAVPPTDPATVAPPVPDVTMDRSALSPGTEGPADSPVVLAVICPAGHHSSPHASTCRVCGRDIPTQQPFQTPRPQLGTLVVSTGGLVPLDRGILLGRAPKVNADLPPSSRPHLVRLASRENDISRNHAEVILEGWHVLVRDLGSTNGTTVTLPGQEPVRLRPTEDFGIEPGAVITLADEVSLTYEVSE